MLSKVAVSSSVSQPGNYQSRQPQGSATMTSTTQNQKNTQEMKGVLMEITRKELDFYLAGKVPLLPVTIEESSLPAYHDKKHVKSKQANSVDILQLRYKHGVEKEFSSTEEFNRVMELFKKIPAQLQLCYSSIPKAGFGICAKEAIPAGCWIGPYEGTRITVQKLEMLNDTRYVWEVYKDDSIDHFINANSTGESSWMKYIRCARSKDEQNAVVFQFAADIFFQTYKPIQPGEELLVWYAENYEKYHGIPVGVKPTVSETARMEQTSEMTHPVLPPRRTSSNPTTPNGDIVTPTIFTLQHGTPTVLGANQSHPGQIVTPTVTTYTLQHGTVATRYATTNAQAIRIQAPTPTITPTIHTVQYGDIPIRHATTNAPLTQTPGPTITHTLQHAATPTTHTVQHGDIPTRYGTTNAPPIQAPGSTTHAFQHVPTPMITSTTPSVQHGTVPTTRNAPITQAPPPTTVPPPLTKYGTPAMTTCPRPIITRTISLANIEKPLVTRFWKCDKCETIFPQKLALKVHKCPLWDAPVNKCKHCDKTFLNKVDLLAHSGGCNSSRRQRCGYCTRRFLNEESLIKHLRVHSKRKMTNGKTRRGRISNYEKYILAGQQL